MSEEKLFQVARTETIVFLVRADCEAQAETLVRTGSSSANSVKIMQLAYYESYDSKRMSLWRGEIVKA